MALTDASRLADFGSGIGTPGSAIVVDHTNNTLGVGTDSVLSGATLQVGTGVTIYGNSGIVSAVSFYGDGSNLTGAGSGLEAASGSQRVVVTSLTSGTMTSAATDADLTFDAGTNTLNVGGGINVSGISTFNVSGVGTVTVGVGTTALLVDGNARVTGILTVGSTSITFDGTNNRIGIGSALPQTTLDLSQETGGIALPQGTTAQRPTGDNPYLRWNSSNNALEFYNGSNWVEIISDYFPTGSMITPD